MLKVAETYVLRAPFVEEGNVRGIDVWAETLDGVSTLPSTIARTGPVDFGTPGDYRHEIDIAAPQGWRATMSPERETHGSPAFDYVRSIEKQGDSVRMVYDMKVKASEVDAAGASAHLEQLRLVRDSMSARLRFAPPAAALDTSERDKRLKALLRDVIDAGGASNTTQGAP